MKVISYVPAGRPYSAKLSAVLEELLPGGDLDVFCSMEDLVRCLKRPNSDFDVTILMADSQASARMFSPLRDILRERRCLILLPANKHFLIIEVDSFRPRFAAWTDGSFRDVAAVMQQIRSTMKSACSSGGMNFSGQSDVPQRNEAAG